MSDVTRSAIHQQLDINDEQARILREAKRGRVVDKYGRWVILGCSSRPQRKEREKLLKRNMIRQESFFDPGSSAGPNRWRLVPTERGLAALDAWEESI